MAEPEELFTKTQKSEPLNWIHLFLGVGNFKLKYLWHFKSYYMHFKAENLQIPKHPWLLFLAQNLKVLRPPKQRSIFSGTPCTNVHVPKFLSILNRGINFSFNLTLNSMCLDLHLQGIFFETAWLSFYNKIMI